MSAVSSTAVRVMVPVKIVPAMIAAGTTIAEPNVTGGEVAWVASAAYAVGDVRVHQGVKWECTRAHTDRTTPPATDRAYWADMGPSDRMAPFDDYASTKARGSGSLTFVLTPGFITGVNVYGPEGATYSIEVRSGGGVIREKHGDLFAQAAGFWELLFAPLPALEKVSLDDVPLAPDAEVSVTVTAPGGGPVAIGDIKVGDWRSLIGSGDWGGVEYGAEAERQSYRYRKDNEDGTYRLLRRGSSRNVTCRVVIDADQAMYADAILGEILDVAVPFEASGLPRYGYLNTLGFVTGAVRADSFGTTSLNLQVKGNI